MIHLRGHKVPFPMHFVDERKVMTSPLSCLYKQNLLPVCRKSASVIFTGNSVMSFDLIRLQSRSYHSTKMPVTTMLTYPWKCTVLHCNHLGNTWKALVLMTRHFDYCPSASKCQVISTNGFQVFPRWLQCKTVHLQG